MMIRPRAGKWELRIRHKLLPRDFYATFATEEEARDYGVRLEALLAQGIVVADLFPDGGGPDPRLGTALRDYLAGAPVPASRRQILEVLLEELGSTRLSAVTYRWAEAWVTRLKRERHLAPGSIRKRVAALAHALDAHHRRQERTWANPLRNLARGYSTYSEEDVSSLAARGKSARTDVKRDRRLDHGEEKRIRAALAGEKREDRERPLEMPDGPALTMLFDLIVLSGMRLREAYTLRVDQIDLPRATINVNGSKAKVGTAKPRQVPISPELRPLLAAWCKGRVGLLFPFWNGEPEELDRVSSKLSRAFSRLFDYARCPELTEHDLRHEACCRWVTLRNTRGGWMFSDLEVCKIMGWTDPKMMLRYASLRGSDLAARFNE